MKDIAKQADVSISTVTKLLPSLAVSAKQLSEVFCIEEFKGNTGYYKYQVSLMDRKTRKPIDIIECRYKSHLFDYFNKFSIEQRKKVKYAVIDLWKAYKDLAKTYFLNAKVVADKFHFTRYATEAVDTVRKQVQERLTRSERKYFKHSRKLLLTKYSKLKEEKQKEELLQLIQDEDKVKAIEKLNNWIKRNLESDIPSLKNCAKTYFNWVEEIRNEIKAPHFNRAMEGYNNKIKTLKRVAFGFRNFTNFKARILLMSILAIFYASYLSPSKKLVQNTFQMFYPNY